MKKAKGVFAVLFLLVLGAYTVTAFLFGLPATLEHTINNSASIDTMEEDVGYALQSSMPWRATMLETHAVLQKAAGKKESGGFAVVEANDGSYINGRADTWYQEEIDSYARKLQDTKSALQDAGLDTGIIFISTQSQIISGYTEPSVAYTLSEETALMESLLYNLRGYTIDFLDVGLTLRESSLEPSEYIYKTDTKWTTQASFMTMMALLGKLQDQYAIDVDPNGLLYNFDNYQFKTHKNVFMGSMGMTAGERFTGREDFVAITPTFDTSFTYEALGDNYLNETGRFDQTLFNDETIYSYDPYVFSSYSAYLDGGAYYWRKIINNDRPDGAKVLYLHDASTLPLAALMAPALGETHMYWPGMAPADAGFDLVSYVQENDIDLILLQGESSIYSLNNLFSF